MGDEKLKNLKLITLIVSLCVTNAISAGNNNAKAKVDLKNGNIKIQIGEKAGSAPKLGSSMYKMYDDMFNKINKKRHGLTDEEISQTKNPFIVKHPIKQDANVSAQDFDVADDTPTYVLYGVLNDRANINGVWHKEGEIIDGLKIDKIKTNSVILDNSGKSLELKLYKGRKNVEITVN